MGPPLDDWVRLMQWAHARFGVGLSRLETIEAPVSWRRALLQPPPTTPEVRPGMVVDGRYHVVRRIGSGGHGVVYEAQDTTLKRHVALKVLRPEGMSCELERERLRREALVLGALDHECFVQIVDFGETAGGLIYLVLEFLDGESLKELIEDGPVPVVEALAIARDILRGLEHLHLRDAVHLDIKPTNVILTSSPEGTRLPKILDLGIAKFLSQSAGGEPSDPTLTHESSLLGTPKYMSPVQSAGGEVDGRADLYALTVVLFEMLTSNVPFESRHISTLLTMHISKAPPTLKSMGMPDPEAALEALIAKGLAKDPDHRFQSATAMREAVEVLLAAAA